MNRIYYGDGTSFEGEWMDGPPDDVQAVAWPNAIVGADFTYGRSYFIIAPPEWGKVAGMPISCDWGGLMDYLRTTPLAGRTLESCTFDELVEVGVKYGRYMTDADFSALVARLRDEMGLNAIFPSRKPDRVFV